MSLRKYLVRRFIIALFILWVIASLNFVIFEIALPTKPQNIYRSISRPVWTPEMRNMLVELWGLNDPMHIRYLKYVKNMFTWNFGYSLHAYNPIAEEMSWRLPATVLLLSLALVATFLIGTMVGILAASKRGSKVDVLAIGGGIFTWAVPIFYTQILLVLLFYYIYTAFGCRVFPLRGIVGVLPTNPLEFMADMAWHLALPLITLVLTSFGPWALMTRNVLLDTLTEDYVVTARAKGLSRRTVLYRHVFRGSLPPIITMITLSIPSLVAGSVITESIFTLPGIGSWYIRGLFSADYPVIESVLFIFAALTVFANLAADFIYGVLDPRIRVGEPHYK